jgi:hypothetical protein
VTAERKPPSDFLLAASLLGVGILATSDPDSAAGIEAAVRDLVRWTIVAGCSVSAAMYVQGWLHVIVAALRGEHKWE